MNLTLQACHAVTCHAHQSAAGVATARTPGTVRSRLACISSNHSRSSRREQRATHICWSERAATPVADQTPSPDGSAVVDNSDQIKVHIKAALMDPEVTEKNQVTPEVKKLIDQLKSVPPADRKKITKEGINGVFKGVLSDFGEMMSSDGMTTLGKLSFRSAKPSDLKVKVTSSMVEIGNTSENQYQLTVPFTIQEGPLEGVQGVQTTKGEYSLDDSKPATQQIGFNGISLRPDTSDSSAQQKWLDVLKQENDNMDDKGHIDISFQDTAHGFKDYLYYDEELQIAIGNPGEGLTIVQRK